MNKINRPKFCDSIAITTLTSNTSLGYYNILMGCLPSLKSAYKEYISTSGVPNRSNYLALTEAEGDALKYYYSHPPLSHNAINDIRRENSNSLCPMCGSMHRGTLDHVLPKEIFPEFSVFSRNLVPACKCNITKGKTTTNNLGARILHPYYDKILSKRLISAKFNSLSVSPTIDIKVLLPASHVLYPSVVYHLDEVVRKNGIIGYLSEQWESFYLHPESVIRGLTPRLTELTGYFGLLRKELHLLDKKHKGKNNWNSVFVSGLYSRAVGEWILTELQSPNRDADGALL
ncbi:hypothetical protein [Serratia quinivorans]|uniref:hypothetical protein n=1 Tax=Serratia quinivorans TaxID=137545 RepID=UPI00217B67D0|nr:hypothetical protein [Serratia quinivorans]CAI0729487.1 Uncharacterised protein [Serratia quinivorans]